MKEYGKLFKRDKIYWLSIVTAVVLVCLYGMAGCYQCVELGKIKQAGCDIAMTRERLDMLLRFWGSTSPDECYANAMRAAFFIVAAAQVVKWHMLEGKHGKEFQKLLPVKGESYITYDFICGMILVWVPVMIGWFLADNWLKAWLNYSDYSLMIFDSVCSLLVINTFLYVLLVFSKKITNHIPGAVFSAFVICLGLYCIQWYTERIVFFYSYLPLESYGVVLMGAMTVLCIILTYLCDKKRDISGNGVFSFRAAHYLILGMVFVELAAVFLPIMGSTAAGRVPGVAGSVLLAGAISFGIHYIARPQNI